MSKVQTQRHSKLNHKASLRNLKLSKINKHIENLSLFEEREDNLPEEDKENQAANVSATKAPGQLRSEILELRQKVTSLEQALRDRQKQIRKFAEEKSDLQQIIHYLKNQNAYLRDSTNWTQRTFPNPKNAFLEPIQTAQPLSPPLLDSPPQDIGGHKRSLLIQLHHQNSMLLHKIMELTCGKNQANDAHVQTSQGEGIQKQHQALSHYLKEVEDFCHKHQLGISGEDFLKNFNELMERYLLEMVEKQTKPLRCEIQLFEEIVRSNKKQHQEKVGYLTKLLEEAHKTIKGLMQELRDFENEAKTNYRLYLSSLRQNRPRD